MNDRDVVPGSLEARELAFADCEMGTLITRTRLPSAGVFRMMFADHGYDTSRARYWKKCGDTEYNKSQS